MTTIYKADLVKYCLRDCPSRYENDCILGDLESSHEEYVELPVCASVGVNSKKLSHPMIELSPLNENSPTQKNSSDQHIKIRQQNNEDVRHPRGTGINFRGLNLTDLDIKILNLLPLQCGTKELSSQLKQPRSTVRYRLSRLEKAGLISPDKGVYGTKLYHISTNLANFFKHNETKPPNTLFTAHNISFKFPILDGKQPKSPKAQEMTNWNSYIFKFPNHTIRATTKHIIIFVNQDLGAASINDLILKYSQIAQSHAYKFAQKHHIVLGGISKYREPHFTLEDNPLAQIIAERGEFKTTSGLQIDKSRSSGDLEMKEETARAMEFTINKLPVIAAELQSEVQQIKNNQDSTHKLLQEFVQSLNYFTAQIIAERAEATPTPPKLDKKDSGQIMYQ